MGQVGSRLAVRLHQAGATVTVTDVDPAKREQASALGVAWMEPDEALARTKH